MSGQAENPAINSGRHWLQSIAAKLQLTLASISALTIGACLIAILRFNDASAVVSRLTDESLPAVKLSLVLENRAERMARALGDLSRAEDEESRKRIRQDFETVLVGIEPNLAALRSTLGRGENLDRLAQLISAMEQAVDALDDKIKDKIAQARTRMASVAAVSAAKNDLILALEPIGDAIIATITASLKNQAGDETVLQNVAQANLPTLRAVYDARADIVAVESILNQASVTEQAEGIEPLKIQFSTLYRLVLDNLEVVIADVNADPAGVDKMMSTVRKLLAVGTGGNNMFDVRIAELRAEASAHNQQVMMQGLSDQLNQEVSKIVADAENGATQTSGQLATEIAKSRNVLILIGSAAVILSLLIGWLFIIRYVAHRMSFLSRSMLAVAEGDLDAKIPSITRDELGDMSRALMVFRDNARDIREARDTAEQARAEAESASRTKSTFLANMSHELRTPLNAIIGYSEIMIEDAVEDDKMESVEDLRKIQNAGKHLLRLINDILDLSKIEAGRNDIYLEMVSVPALVEELHTLAVPLASANQNNFVVSVEDGITDFRTDVTKLKQSLLNLVSNACKFTKQGKVSLNVSRHTAESGEELHFVVSDSGIGMTQEQIGKLFQPFVQADSSTTRQFGGTGLGLAITRQFCRLLDGDVTVTSVPGQGSAFKIVLPVKEFEETDSAEALVGSRGDQDALAVLVVDDDKQVHDLLGAMLTREGYRVLHAGNGREAVARARNDRPAAILLDIMMPHIDGWTVLSELKDDPALESIPVVIVSMLDERPLGLSLGAAEFLTKPVDRSKLMATIEKHIQKKQGPILIVEDGAADREFLSHALKGFGASTVAVENGRLALEWLDGNTTPSAMILDLMMPDLDGFAVLEAVRKNPRLQDLPVIVLTAKDLSAEEMDYLHGCGGVVIEKGPDTRAVVLGALRKAIH